MNKAIVFAFVLLSAWGPSSHAEPDWKWILLDVYWNQSGGQVCEYQRIGGRSIRKIVRARGYGCPNKSMNPYHEK